MKKQIEAILSGKNLFGYTWCYFDKGTHVFSRKCEKGYEVIKALPEDLTNGNLDYFLENGWSR